MNQLYVRPLPPKLPSHPANLTSWGHHSAPLMTQRNCYRLRCNIRPWQCLAEKDIKILPVFHFLINEEGVSQKLPHPMIEVHTVFTITCKRNVLTMIVLEQQFTAPGIGILYVIKHSWGGASLVVQWLRLRTPDIGGSRFDPWSENYIPHAAI